MRQLRRQRLGFWLGVLAVTLNALLPIHFAARVADAASVVIADALHLVAEYPWHIHRHHPLGPAHHQDGACPICAAGAAAISAATLPSPPPLVLPIAPKLTIIVRDSGELGRDASHTAYAPRGPPTAA